MIRRNSDTSDHEMGHSLILEEYESVILNVDSDSPVMYVGQEVSLSDRRGKFPSKHRQVLHSIKSLIFKCIFLIILYVYSLTQQLKGMMITALIFSFV